jgi:AcrR family transcriptional regulator
MHQDPNLLVKATLEGVLAKAADRHDAEARVHRLKAAALMECAEKGYADLTIAGVARRAKVSTATIYADYKDRDALLVSSLELLLDIVAGDAIEVPPIEDPIERVKWLLVAHGKVYAEAIITWFFRLHVVLAWSGYPHLHQVGRMVFGGIDAFWANFLQGLVDDGLLQPLDMAVAVPMLLGPIERCTIISRLACGDDESGRVTLEAAARFGAQSLFKVYGRGAPPPPTCEGMPSVVAAPTVSLEARFTEAMLNGSSGPTPSQRKERILLAALIECQERGYNGANMAEIAGRAGVSMATVYKNYTDKVSLFMTGLKREATARNTATLPQTTASPAAASIASDVLTRAMADSDPDWVWIQNIIMASEISASPPIVAFARQERDGLEARWAAVFEALVTNGTLKDVDHALATNALLGAVERAGVLSLVLFGRDAIDQHYLAKLAAASTSFVLAAYRA